MAHFLSDVLSGDGPFGLRAAWLMKAIGVLIFCGVVATTGLHSAQDHRDLVTLVQPVGYSGDYYIGPPSDGMHLVYFAGEMIEADVVIANWGELPRSVRSVAGMSAGLRWNDREQVGQPRANFHAGALVKRSRAGTDSVGLAAGETVALEPRDRLMLRVSVPASSLSSGRHTIDFVTDVADDRGQSPVAHSSLFKFEVRLPSSADQLELARRAASKAFDSGDYHAARREVERMLRLQPSSIFAYLTRGDVEAAEGRWRAAISAYEMARRLTDTRTDSRLAERYIAEFQWDHLREGIGTKLAQARSRVAR